MDDDNSNNNGSRSLLDDIDETNAKGVLNNEEEKKEEVQDEFFKPGSNPSTKAILSKFFWIAFPIVISTMLMLIRLASNVAIAGHLEDPDLQAAVGIGTTTCNIMILSLLLGLNAAQETLTS